MIITILIILAIAGFATTVLCINQACHNCPNKHLCEDMEAHGTPNLCEQNQTLQQNH